MSGLRRMDDGKKQDAKRPAAQAMLAAAKRFVEDRRGAFAMQFALMILPLMVCTGLAIDGGRAFLAKYELGQALDAAALAVGSTTTNDDAEMTAVAQRYLNLNYRGDKVADPSVEVERDEEVVTLTGSVQINTFFMPLIGRPTVDIAAASEVQRGGGNVEVVLALDITGSMSGSMDTLRTAANSLIDAVVKPATLVNGDPATFYSRAAVVPWSNNIHLGADRALALRGPIRAATAITGAEGRVGAAMTITKAHWREGAEASISAAAWKNGTAKTATKIERQTAAGVVGRLKVSLTNHGFVNDEFVRFTGANNGMTGLNNNVYRVADKGNNDFYLKNAAGTDYITMTGTPSAATTASMQRCYNAACQIRVTTSANHGFTDSSLVYIKGVGGMTVLNNPAANMTWTIARISDTMFYITEIDGPTVTTTFSGNSGKASWCIVESCKIQVTTSGSHGFSANDFVNVKDVAGATFVNKTVNTSWVVDSVTSTTFLLANTSPTTGTASYTGGGVATRCVLSTCEVRVTSAAHGLANNEYVKITGVSGMTEINTTGTGSWKVAQADANTFVLASSAAVNYGTYSASASAAVECLSAGCNTQRYIKGGTTTTVVNKNITNCVSERVGAQAYTDAPPGAGAYLGYYYPAGGENFCGTSNTLIPLTNDKDALKAVINDMDLAGSTGGQIGTAWGWYMLSPRWGDIWEDFDDGVSGSTTEYFAPARYDAPKTSKVLVLMTDGEFNSAHCNGVISNNYAYTTGGAEKINCNATNGSPYTQAEALCDNMSAAGTDIIIYTVGFKITEGSTASQFLRNCATAEENYFLASNSAALQSTFERIAKSITKLRISK